MDKMQRGVLMSFVTFWGVLNSVDDKSTKYNVQVPVVQVPVQVTVVTRYTVVLVGVLVQVWYEYIVPAFFAQHSFLSSAFEVTNLFIFITSI
jgi:hypothetical protein